jgi:hypothetical protein
MRGATLTHLSSPAAVVVRWTAPRFVNLILFVVGFAIYRLLSK